MISSGQVVSQEGEGDPPPPQDQRVEVYDNHIYFYREVTEQSCLSLIRTLQEVDSRLSSERRDRRLYGTGLADSTPICLHIHSEGGDLFPALAVADHITQLQTPVHSVIEGIGASAATLLSMACHRRYIMSRGFVLIHQFSGDLWGTYEQMKDRMNLSDMIIETLVDFYTEHSSMGVAEVRSALQRDSWFNAKQALEKGIVDQVLVGLRVVPESQDG